jgi:hypothetical protein
MLLTTPKHLFQKVGIVTIQSAFFFEFRLWLVATASTSDFRQPLFGA